MAEDKEYDEVEAVVRIPKGGRLADSRKTEGWSRGFTPKSTDKGPEHVEIRLKDEGDPQSVLKREVIHTTEYVETPRQPERSIAEQAMADFLYRVIDELIEAAKPHVAHWWNTQVIPAMRAKRDDFMLKCHARKAKKAQRGKATTSQLIAEPAAEDEASLQQVASALDDPKITMTSDQFQQLFMTWLAREDSQQALWHAIANAHIKDGDAKALAWREGLNQLSPQQRTERVKEILSSNLSILEDLGRHLIESGPLKLEETIRARDQAYLVTTGRTRDIHRLKKGQHAVVKPPPDVQRFSP